MSWAQRLPDLITPEEQPLKTQKANILANICKLEKLNHTHNLCFPVSGAAWESQKKIFNSTERLCSFSQ